MAEFYTDDRRNLHFDAPQYNKSNHRYRGPRESEKINLEINQTAFSIFDLYKKYEDLNDELEYKIELLVDGGDVVPVEDTVLPGDVILAARINELRKRVQTLEENRN